MQNEILRPVFETDETAIPRYDIVNPDGSVTQQNVELRLKNEIMQHGTPYDEESVLPTALLNELGLPTSATPAQAFQGILTKFRSVFTKSETLSAVTAALFGLGADAVPDDAFNWIGKFNQYWWSALDISYAAVIGDAYTINLTRATEGSIKTTINYSSQIEVSSTGELSLVNPSSGEFYSSAYSNADILKGKYIQGAFENTSAIFYIAADAPNATRLVSGNYVYIKVTASMVSSVNPNTSRYVNSANRNMYPDCGEQDGTEYRFIGIPFSNLLSSPKIEKGSYIGTGTYDSNSPVCITTSRKPVIIFVKTRETVYSTSPFMILFPFIYDENYKDYACFMSYYSSGYVNGLYGYAKIVDNSVYFYGTSSNFLSFNKERIKYEWIAICGLEGIA